MSASPSPRAAASAAVIVGLATAFVVGVDAVRAIRPGLLTDSEPSWSPYRLALALGVATIFAGAGTSAAAILVRCARARPVGKVPKPLPLGVGALIALAAAGLGLGVALRFVALTRLPEWLWIDDVSLIGPALALQGSLADFADTVRPVPFGVPKLYGTVGVLYLEAFRGVLLRFGTTVFSLRFVSALAGCMSLVTAALLGRRLLPRGGGMLTAIVLAGLRWHLILSRWAWVMIVLAPVVDMATLLLLRARRRQSLLAALLSGAVVGLGAHVYLSAWIAAAALLGLALWPGEPTIAKPARLRLGMFFILGLTVAAAPLFLFHRGRMLPYFARTSDHNILREIRYTRTVLPVLSAAADGLVAPWITADPASRHDLPGRSRLGWILGIPVLAALLQALLWPRRELSGFFLLHGGCALAATVAGGQAGTPNGSRFAYLTTVTAVAAAAGVTLLLNLVASRRRRMATLAAVGLLALSGALGARDALLEWPQRRETFDGFHGQDTLIARTASRWERYGTVAPTLTLVHSPVTFEAIRLYRLDTDARPGEKPGVYGTRRAFRVLAPAAMPMLGERCVEQVRDPWGKTWAVVLGRATGASR